MIGFWIVLIPLLPLIAFVANGLFGRQLKRAGGWLAVGCMGGSALIGTVLFLGAVTNILTLPIEVRLWEWMVVGDLSVSFSFYVDQLTCFMLFYVTFVSSLVFLYSMGYMEGDPGFNRFFAYLGLFDFSMLILVLGESLPVVFVGWEGVGLCSYLLIGYYMSLPGAPDAGKKAFIMNRIGDFGFLVAMFMLFAAVGTLSIPEVVEHARVTGLDEEGASPLLKYGGAYVTILTLMFFLGCTGKSAQIPLFTWLPDAMAGPTPVSALIHAATMVTAGVYLVVRLAALFALAPTTMLVIAVIAALTAFIAGSIALTQRDIKKVLAYSTVSQLGFMFLACGVGAFVAGIFHVFTHSFFKACLFLGAGSVIHAAHHEQNMFKLGGLRKAMPVTAITFFIACLAIAGFPLLSGFFSKDEILWKTFSNGHFVLWTIGIGTALMTAVYSFRVYFLTFCGECRIEDKHAREHVHESPWTMTGPLLILAIGAAIAGIMNLPKVGSITQMLDPVVASAHEIIKHNSEHHAIHNGWLEIGLMLISTLIAVWGIFLARRLFLKHWPEAPTELGRKLGLAYKLSYNRWWWDDIYRVFVGGLFGLVAKLSTLFDRWVIDGILHTIAGVSRLGSFIVRATQNGQVQAYALMFLLGVNLVVWLVLWYG